MPTTPKAFLLAALAVFTSGLLQAQNISVVAPAISGYNGSDRPAHFNWQFQSSGGGEVRMGQFACGSWWVAPAAGDSGVTLVSLTGNPSWNDQVSCDADPVPESHGLLDGSNGYGSYNAAENIIPNLPMIFSPAGGSCNSLVAAMQRNEAETSPGGTAATVGEVVDAYCVVTVLPDVPANDGADMIRPNVTGTYKEFLSWDDFDLSRIPTYSFLEGKTSQDWESTRIRWTHAVEVFGIFTEIRPGVWNKYSEGGRAFRSHIIVPEYGAGTARVFNNDLLALLSDDNSIEQKRSALAAMLAYGLDIYHARYDYGTGKVKAWSSGAGQSVGTSVPATLLAALLIDQEKANQLKMDAVTNHDEDRALRGPQELRQATRGVTGVLLWGDNTPFIRNGNNASLDDLAYWGRLVISGCFDGSINECEINGGSKTSADPYGYTDGPPNSPGFAYMSVASGGVRSFAAIMILMPSFREVVNTDDPIEYADRITRHGLWTYPDPVAIPSIETQLEKCSVYGGPCPDFGVTWGADPADVRFAIEDGAGRFVSKHGKSVSFSYEPSRSANHWPQIIALYDGDTFEDNAVPLGVLVSPEIVFEFGESPKAHIRTPNVLAEIRYTLDGSEPDASSALYTGPVAVSAGTVVRAKAFQSGKVASKTRTKGYLADLPGDTKGPSVSITSPIINQEVADQVIITASASDASGVAGVQFLIDGEEFGIEDIEAPYSVSWDTSLASNGRHSISARARDAEGNMNYAPSIPVLIDHLGPDTVAPTIPQNLTVDSVGYYSVELSWDASTDSYGVLGYEVLINGSNPVDVRDTAVTLTGLASMTAYTLTVRAYDAAGNTSAESDPVEVTTLEAPEAGTALMIDFGPTVPVGAHLTNSPAHQEGAVSGDQTYWNVAGADPGISTIYDQLNYANAAPAFAVQYTLGASSPGSKVINFGTPVGNSNALGSARSAGIYEDSSVGRDGIWSGSGSTNDTSMGMRMDGLQAGSYSVYVMACNTNSGASDMNVYILSGSQSSSYDFSADTPYFISNDRSDSWSAGENYAVATVEVANQDSLYILTDGAVPSAERGFLNAVQIIGQSTGGNDWTWAGRPVDGHGNVDTLSALGTLHFPSQDSAWAWTSAMHGWLHAPDPGPASPGAWVFLAR